MTLALYALVDRVTLTVIKRKSYDNPELADHPDKPKWVPVIEGAKPAFDPNTEKLVRGETVTLTEVTVSWTKTALTADEKRDRVDPITDVPAALIAKGRITKSDLASRLGR